ncbi:MAG: TAXI family TRAP transporter solute-binding subunit [Chloroflexi bacterium]|nr:TAXI family TRAP transporter solute-binding subunit [Chloroflexota bacterium]
MKKLALTSATLVIAMIMVLAACAPKQAPRPAATPAPAPTSAPAPAATAAPAPAVTQAPAPAATKAPAPAATAAPAPVATAAPAPAAKLPAQITIGVRALGSRSHSSWTPIAPVLSKYSGMKVNIEPIGGIGTVAPFAEKDVNFLIHEAAPDGLFYFRGSEHFEKQGPHPWMRKLTSLYFGDTAVQVRADSNITKVEDLAGKKVMWSSDSLLIKLILEALLENRKVNATVLMGGKFSDVIQQLIEGKIDAAVFSISAPSLELDRSRGFRMLPFNQSDIDHFNKKAGTTLAELDKFPPNWLGIKGDTTQPTLFVNAGTLYARKDFPADAAYALLKALFEHRDEFKDAFPATGSQIKLENAHRWGDGAPYHDGAIRFYKEKNAWPADVEARHQGLLKEAAALEAKTKK